MTDYGTDIACMTDADDLFSECSGLAVVAQDAFHRITTDSILGPRGADWGKNCLRLIGLPLNQIAAEQTSYEEVLTRDERIDRAVVRIQAVADGNTVGSGTIIADCYTVDGQSFRLVVPVSNISAATYEEL